MKGRWKQVIGDISDAIVLDYVTKLYNHAHAIEMGKEDLSVTCTSPFIFEDIEAGQKKMANGKASYHMKIQAEFVKWTGDRARTWLSHILTHALHHGFPQEWQENWVQPVHKGGDKNSVNKLQNYNGQLYIGQIGRAHV